jgi:DNA-binding CsgD family transcriptional regulator
MGAESPRTALQELISGDNHIRKCVADLLHPVLSFEHSNSTSSTEWLEKAAADLGFRYICAGLFPERGDASLRDSVLVTNWPDEFLMVQENLDDFSRSIPVALMSSSTYPLIRRNKDLFDLSSLDATGMAEAEMATMLLSFHNAVGRRYFFMMSALASEFHTISISRFYLAAMEFVERRFFEAVNDNAEIIPLRKKRLSGRELECLRWAAEGKTTDVIATILGISGHTVNLYFQSAIDKLSAVNRTQAVAKAMRMGAI